MTYTEPGLFQDGLFSPPAGPARATAWQAVVKAWITKGPGCGERSPASWLSSVPPGSSARTSLVCYPSTAATTSARSSTTWPNSGMGGPFGCSTLVTSASPSVARESSLSDVLEIPGPHLRRFCLSPRAARGILRRAERRGRALPESLRTALETLATQP